MALLTGDSLDAVSLQAEGRFTVADGALHVEAMRSTVGPVTLVIGGRTDLTSGEIDMTARLAPGSTGGGSSLLASLAAARVTLPLGGTVRQPKLEVQAPRGALTAELAKMLTSQVDEQIARLRAKEAQRQMNRSQQEIDDMLKPLRGMDQRHRAATRRGTTVPSAAPLEVPATEPATGAK
jgi:hypothetical protein